MTDEIKTVAQNMTPDAAADKFGALIEKDKTRASIGFDDVVSSGQTIVTKDSITFSKSIPPQIEKSAGGFANGYESAVTYTEQRDVLISVKFSRVQSIKIHETKNGYLMITIKDPHESLITKTMYQFDTKDRNRELAIALCSVLMPNAKIN